jgi:hypothetical protein
MAVMTRSKAAADLSEGDVLVETDATPRWAGRKIMLNAIALEDIDATVVAFHRECDREAAERIFCPIANIVARLMASAA